MIRISGEFVQRLGLSWIFAAGCSNFATIDMVQHPILIHLFLPRLQLSR